ncbi:MAG: peptidoglycan-binding domain-containing protein [Candidatus Taylorbacteria bacterium]|nr:peptidoglycan-binding domain-containing protein [Candidatus Taylorbacteria bacterium]
MKNYTNSVVFTLILGAIIVIAPVMVKAQANGGDDVVANVAVAGNSSTSNGGDDIVNSNTSNGDDDVAKNSSTTNGSDDTVDSETTNGDDDVPNNSSTTNGSDDISGSNSNTSNGGDDTTGGGTTPTTPVADNNNNGGGGGSSGGGSRNRGSTLVTNTVLPILTNIGDCLYLNSYLKIGRQNDSAEVTKLQTFLKNTEKLDVDINGIFDLKTFNAVKAFQAKYVDDVMAPWGVRTPTGQVFYTTKNKVNEIVCKANFSLTAAQLAQIEAYRKGVASGTITVDEDGNVTNASSTDGITGTSTEVGTNGGTDGSQEASLAGTSFLAKIWAFIKWIFGY